MPAYNLVKSLKRNLKSSVVTTASQRINSVVPGVSTQLMSSALSGVSVKGALLGAAAGKLLNGNQGAALGAIAGGLFGGEAGDLISNIRNKLGNAYDDFSNSSELSNLYNNAVRIAERGAADLAGIQGGKYGLQLAQYKELDSRTSISSSFVDRGFLPSHESKNTAASKVPNPLRNYNGVNYIITLGILSAKEYNNPETYRKIGFKNHIIQSSGGNLGKRYQVFDEHAGNVAGVPQLGHLGSQTHAEYYIDDIELDSIVAPNQNTRMTLGTSLSFTVTEPYSMGNFIQAIKGSSSVAGYANYAHAPFCIRIDFAGYNLDGTTAANFVTEPMYIPIKIINMEFNVSGIGSKYTVTAVPMSETGLSDEIDKVNTSVKATGVLCHEILETNDQSVTGAINSQIEALEDAGAISPYDRYIICFPKTRKHLKDAYQKGEIQESAFTSTPEDLEIQRRGTLDKNPDIQSSFSPTTITIEAPNDTYAILKSFAENTDLMNQIGLSPLNEDTNAPGNKSAADAQAVINPESNIVDTASIGAQPADKSREHQFNQGEKITNIIEKLVVQSSYAAEKATAGAKNGMNKWFRIDTHVYIDEGALTEATIGRRPRVYVYSVIEYEVDQAVTMAGNQAPQNTEGLKKLAQKEYNYIYTGKNEDVLNFDLNFNNAFMMTAFADLGMSAASIRAGADNATTVSSSLGTDGGVQTPVGGKGTNEDGSPGTAFDTKLDNATGYAGNDVRRKIAEIFHDKITKMNVDLVSAEMEIMGDPYFIPQQTGNYVAGTDATNPQTIIGNTINYLDQSVFCIVNFKTPFDYQIKGATMEFPQIVSGFSGLFQIWAVVNRFSSGKFTQTLKLIRRKGQDDEETTANSGTMVVNNDAALTKDGVQSDGTIGGQRPGIDCMPASRQDDITNLDRAIDNKITSDNAAPYQAAILKQADRLTSLLDGKDLIGEVPDLTKVISTLNNFTSGLSNAPMVGIGSVSSARVRGAMGAIRPTDGMNALDVLAEEAAIVNRAAAAAKGTINNAVNTGIDAATNATKSRINNLLGGPR